MSDDLWSWSAADLARAIAAGQITSAEATTSALARMDAVNPAINAVVIVDKDRARARALQADAALAGRQHWGPLHGVPTHVKEAFDIEGLVTTFGDEDQRDNVASSDALAV